MNAGRFLAALLGAIALSALAWSAVDAEPSVSVRDTASFTVVDDPPQPLALEEFVRRVAPGIAEGAYGNGEGGYGIVIPGADGKVDLGVRLTLRGAAPLASGMVFDARFPAQEVPPTPFTLVEQLIDLRPGASTVRFAYGGEAFFLVADGAVWLERGGVERQYHLGEHFSVTRGEVFRLANSGPRRAAVMATVLLPEAARLTSPRGAY